MKESATMVHSAQHWHRADRRYFVGGSDARIIIVREGDASALQAEKSGSGRPRAEVGSCRFLTCRGTTEPNSYPSAVLVNEVDTSCSDEFRRASAIAWLLGRFPQSNAWSAAILIDELDAGAP
jgi:hypothetical protein